MNMTNAILSKYVHVILFQEHEQNCNYIPLPCKNLGCNRLVSKFDMDKHLEECGHGIVKCKFCHAKMKRLALEVSYSLIPSVNLCAMCVIFNDSFNFILEAKLFINSNLRPLLLFFVL